MLLQVAYGRIAARGDATAIGGLLSRQYAQQRSLARTVGANQGDMIAASDLNIDVVENRFVSKGLVQAFGSQQYHRIPSVSWKGSDENPRF